MSFIGKAIGKITGADSAARAAESAGRTQAASAQAGIDEQRRQFDALQAIMQPFVQAGTGALTGYQDLLGMNGQGTQAAAIDTLRQSPQFGALQRSGHEAILQNASATGGLRGGNVQSALAQFDPALLSALIDQQYSRLGGLAGLGQNAAAGVGNAGLISGNSVSNLLQQQGAARAGGQIAQGNVARTGFGDLLKIGAVAGGFF